MTGLVQILRAMVWSSGLPAQAQNSFLAPAKDINTAHEMMDAQEAGNAHALQVEHSWEQHVGLWPLQSQLHHSP